MDKILEFIELQDTISYNQSFDLALKCSRLIASGTEEELVMARKIIIRVLDELKKIPKETYDIWSDLVEAVGFYPYLEKNKKILEQNSLADEIRIQSYKSDYLDNKYSLQELRAGIHAMEFNLDYRTILNPHVLNVLPRLKKAGYKLAIASSSSMENIKTVTSQCGIDQYFDCMVSGFDFEESKPDPAIYLETLQRLDLKPEEVIAIEDSTYGIQACINANVRVIAKEDHRYNFNQGLADVIASDILEAFNIIEYWNKE